MSETALANPSWAAEAIWWQVYPLGFTGAPPDEPPDGARPRHHLRRLESWLDYAADLGCSGLLLGPIFAALTHGYDTTDHFRIDPRLGDDAIRPAYPADPGHLPASGHPAYRLHQQLIDVRRRHPWLAAARTTVAHLTNRAVALEADAAGGGTRVITLLNVDDRPQEFPLDLSGVVTTELLGPEARDGEPATLPAHAWRIIVCRPIPG